MERNLYRLKSGNSVKWHPKEDLLAKNERSFRFVPKDTSKINVVYNEKMIEAIWGIHTRTSQTKLEKLRIRHITQER